MRTIVYYTTESGNSPVEDFLKDLDKKARAKVMAIIELLAEKGADLKRPYAAPVRNKVWELRAVFASNQYRILYFAWVDDNLVLLHGFQKKSQQLKDKDIKIAEDRVKDWMSRF